MSLQVKRVSEHRKPVHLSGFFHRPKRSRRASRGVVKNRYLSIVCSLFSPAMLWFRAVCGPLFIPLLVMPSHFCAYPGCCRIVPFEVKFCDKHRERGERHEAEQKARRDTLRAQRRGSAAARGYGYKWRMVSQAFLDAHPLCAECERRGLIRPATCVDHIKPHKGDKKLFWDRSNWQPLCQSCHSEKTAREDGGFGNPTAGG